MHKSNHHAIRMLLQQYHDGLTVADIAERLEKEPPPMRRALTEMPDAYIDRWIAHRKQWTAVWCVIVAPENCPKPTKKPNVRPTQLRSMEPRNLSEIRFGFVLTNASPTGRH
jgi:hypothetical protein